MKILLKVLGVLFVLAVLLFVGAYVTLRAFFPSDKIRPLIVQQLESRLNRKVEIRSVSLGLLGKLNVRGFKVYDLEKFGGGSFLESEGFVLRLRLWPLLFKKVIVDRVELIQPKVRLIRSANGLWNFTDWIPVPESPEASPPATRPTAGGASQATTGLGLHVARAAILQGVILFEDQVLQTSYRVNEVTFRLSDFSVSELFPVHLSFRVQADLGGESLDGTFRFDGQVDLANLQWAKSKLILEKLQLASNGMTLRASGKLSNWLQPNVQLNAVLPRFNSERIKPVATLQQAFETPKARMSLDAATSDFRSFHIKSLELEAASMKMEGKGRIDLTPSRPQISASVSTNLFSVKYFTGMLKSLDPYELSGKVQWNLEVQGSLPGPLLNGRLVLKDFQALYNKQRFSSLRGEVLVQKNELTLPKLTGKWNDREFSFDLAIQDIYTLKHIKLHGHLSQLIIPELSALLASDSPT